MMMKKVGVSINGKQTSAHEHKHYELLVGWQATIYVYLEVNNHDDDGGERVAIWLIRAFIVVIRDTL